MKTLTGPSWSQSSPHPDRSGLRPVRLGQARPQERLGHHRQAALPVTSCHGPAKGGAKTPRWKCSLPILRCRAGVGSLSGEGLRTDSSCAVLPCVAEGPAGAQDERDGEFGDGRFDEPTAANRVALAWNPRRRVMKVRMSDTELSKPKTIMKVRMDRRFQVRGRPGCPGSALPGQQPGSAGAGDMRLAGRLLCQQGRDPWRAP